MARAYEFYKERLGTAGKDTQAEPNGAFDRDDQLDSQQRRKPARERCRAIRHCPGGIESQHGLVCGRKEVPRCGQRRSWRLLGKVKGRSQGSASLRRPALMVGSVIG